jgi:hypothetical protein
LQKIKGFPVRKVSTAGGVVKVTAVLGRFANGAHELNNYFPPALASGFTEL